MLFSFSQAVVAVVSVLPIFTDALNIIVNNDDGFAAANIREFYRLLKAAGHNGTPLSMSTHVVPPLICAVSIAWIVAPVNDNSGQGGRVSVDAVIVDRQR